MSDDVLIFLHLPKTAGTTFREMMTRQYPASVMYDFKAGDERRACEIFQEMDPKILAKLRVISGHVPFGIHGLFGRSARYLTILRDPVDRMVSQYFHVLRNQHHYCYDEVAGRKMSLAEFVTSGLTRETDNAQTRMLAGIEQPAFGACDDALLKKARANMRKHVALVGLTERFEQTALLARALLGWKKPPYFSVRNVGWNKRKSIPAEQLEEVRDFNRLDLAVYKTAREMLDTLTAKHVPNWEQQLPSFQRRNMIFQKAKRTKKIVRGLLKM